MKQFFTFFIDRSISFRCFLMKQLGFAASGKITFDGYSDPITYSYNEHHDNRNDRTIAMFSKLANDKMRPCSKCQFYTEFSRMSLFFGKPDFADQWIHAALKGNRTVFDSSTADFESMSLETRAGEYYAAYSDR